MTRTRKKYRIYEGDGDPRHGTFNAYANLGCRCSSCRTAWAAYRHEWMHAQPERLRVHAERQKARYYRNMAASRAIMAGTKEAPRTAPTAGGQTGTPQEVPMADEATR